ncbi:hypothetical protein LX81_03001 [Palleronia aestuarii]|uniref:Uncharacterized protein n=1 Tax=Palleronia aestuarii TaxID=568105 RepID=A0A2W7NSH0_9RHOB|nr:hypothetical protein [Palleronia aestuarii]PZX14202.1 hypothetical protein LX81_03001 [Palleronia aestuarii]
MRANAQEAAPETLDQAVDVDPSFMLSKLEGLIVGFQNYCPTSPSP